jgi:hypothetical protein
MGGFKKGYMLTEKVRGTIRIRGGFPIVYKQI